MPNKIKPKRSYTANSVPLTTDLETNELAINWADGKAFTKNASGQIVSVTLGGSGGSSSSEDTALRAYFVPTAPTNVTATAGNGQASVTWTASTTIAQIPVTDYLVQYSSNSGSTGTTFSDGTATSTSAVVTGLTNGTAYTFRVAGVNGVGTGAYSSASSAVTPQAGDPLFGNVSLLLHMDGSGSTFVDSSAYGQAITANGDITQSTAQSKFGGKSAAFDGSGDFLTTPEYFANTLGTGDFAIEFWCFANSVGGNVCLIDQPNGLLIRQSSGNQLAIYDRASGGHVGFSSDNVLTAGQWQHIAVARTGSTLNAYVNGSRVIATTLSSNLSGNSYRIGAFIDNANPGFVLNGFIDELRITRGNNRSYTGATITVPTSAFPEAVPGADPLFSAVSLLLHADGSGSTFVDSSSNAIAITAGGNVTQSTTQSKFGGKSAALAPGNYLSAAASNGFAFGTGDFAVEFWLYVTSAGGNQCVIDFRNGSSTAQMFLRMTSDTNFEFRIDGDAIHNFSATSGQWNHIAIARSGGTVRSYVNGTRVAATPNSSNLSANGPMLVNGFYNATGNGITGFIDEIRVTKGFDRSYTGATITVPTAPFPDA